MEPQTRCEPGPHCYCRVDAQGSPECHRCGHVKRDEDLLEYVLKYMDQGANS